jgi:hypothetical protein
MTDASSLLHLDRLEGYLRQDPDNPRLLVEAFDTALQAGELIRAERPLRHARHLGASAHGRRIG